MPNPLLKLGNGANRGHKPPDRPEPIDPIPEHYVGSNHPYRGIEDHGVADTVKPDEFDGYDGTRDAYYELQEPPKDVVPVRIVNESARERKIIRARSTVLSDQPVQILGRNPQRRKAILKANTQISGGGDGQQLRQTWNVGDGADKTILNGISGKLVGITAYNTDTGAHGVNAYDPAVNAVSNASLNLLFVGPAPAAGTIGSAFPTQPIAFSNGLIINVTGAIAANPVFVTVHYIPDPVYGNVYISGGPNVSAMNGYLLTNGVEETIDIDGEVYAIATGIPGGTQLPISVLEFLGIEI